MTDSSKVAAARIRAETSRSRLMETARELQVRVSPGTLAHQAWEGTKNKGADLAETAVDAVRARPVAATTAVAALALFLAREPIKDLAGRIGDELSSRRATKRARKRSVDNTEPNTENAQ